MRDPDIREAMNRTLLAKHRADQKTRVVEEMALSRGKSRIDVAVINGEFCGFEIKSARDTLDRLPHQLGIYNAVFDRVTIVLSHRHLHDAIRTIPPWWGIELVLPGEIADFEQIRKPDWNQDVVPGELVQLLWREEALDLLEELGADHGVRSRPKRYIWERLAEVTTADFLRPSVRERLKLRPDWRVRP